MRVLATIILVFGLAFAAPLLAGEEGARPDIINILTARLATTGDEQEAAEIADALRDVYSTSESASAQVLVSQSELVIEDGDMPIALYKLDRALFLDGDLVEAYVLRGEIHLGMGRIEEGFDDAMTAVELAPDYYESLALLARAFEARGHSASALVTSRRALERYPLSEELRAQLAHHEMQAAGAGL